MRVYLAEYAEPIRKYLAGKKDLVDQAILMWNSMYAVVDRYRSAHRDWAFVRHEDLAADPPAGFRALYRHCRLEWNPRSEAAVRKFSENPDARPLSRDRPTDIRRESSKTVSVWRRILTPEETDRIRMGTRQVAGLFYEPEDW